MLGYDRDRANPRRAEGRNATRVRGAAEKYPTGTLSGTKTVAAVNGAATFSDLSIDQPGIGYTLVVTSSSLRGTASASFNVLTPSLPPLSGLP